MTLLIIYAIVFSVVNGAGRFTVDPLTRAIRDQYGRHMLFHGVNVVYKLAPYIPEQKVFDASNSLADKDIVNLKGWGMNFVRLGVMWEAVLTSDGKFNDTYMSEIDKLVTKLGEQGIYTLIDAHQDANARMNCGEGWPNFLANEIVNNGTYCFGDWADAVLGWMYPEGICKPIKAYGYGYGEDGLPNIKDCEKTTFFNYYLSPESMTLFRALYNNNFGFQDKYLEFQSYVANYLKDNQYVVGYDPINEPNPGWSSIFNLLDLATPGNTDRLQLQPFYAKIFEKYIAANSENIMMFEGTQYPDMLPVGGMKEGQGAVIFPYGFTAPPGGVANKTHNHVLNEHTYCCQYNTAMCDPKYTRGEPNNTKEVAATCKEFHTNRFTIRANDAKKLGLPLIISEFGSCLDTESCKTEVTQVTDLCDEHLASWAYWQFKDYEDITSSAGLNSEGFYNKTEIGGGFQAIKVKPMTRSYVKAAQGTITFQQFFSEDSGDYKAGYFIAYITLNASISQPTLVHALVDQVEGLSWYPKDVELEIRDKDNNILSQDQSYITWDLNEMQIPLADKFPGYDGQQLKIILIPNGTQTIQRKSHMIILI